MADPQGLITPRRQLAQLAKDKALQQRAQAMFASSSNRALISTSASTALPDSAAAMSASTIGLSPEVR